MTVIVSLVEAGREAVIPDILKNDLAPTHEEFRRRSQLFLPLIRIEKYGKNIGFGADTIIFDLEDSVLPDAKPEARKLFEKIKDFPKPERVEYSVRINGWETEDFALDIDALSKHPGIIDSVTIAMTENADVIQHVRQALPDVSIITSIETPRGAHDAWDFLHLLSRGRGDAVGFAIGDYALTCGVDVREVYESPLLVHGLTQIAEVAAAFNLPLIDSVNRNFEGNEALELLKKEAEFTKKNFNAIGKKAINPKQVPTINQVFTPSFDEIEKYVELLNKFEGTNGLAAARTSTAYESITFLKKAVERVRSQLSRGYVELRG